MKRGRLILAGAAALFISATGWYYGSPWWTLWRVREAARAGDAETLARHVDVAAIAADAKAQLLDTRRAWVASIPADNPNLGGLLAVIDRALERPGVMDFRPWLATIPIRFAGLGESAGNSVYRPYVVHRGLDAFEVRQQGASLEYGPRLTFRRHGLGWKLVAVRWGQQ